MTVEGIRVLVTGGAGFIGSHVVEALVRRGAEVTVVDRQTSRRETHLSGVRDHIQLIQMDIQEAAFRSLVMDERFHAIFHFAGPASVPRSVEFPYEDFEQSLHNTIHLLELLRTACRDMVLIIASSAAVYGNPVKLPMSETDPTFPISPYGVSKLAAERYVSVYSQLYDISAASLRFFSIYGPRQRQLIVYDLMTKLVNDPDHLTMLGDGTETRDFIYIDDVVRAILTVYEHGALKGEVYNIASGTPHTTLEVAQTIASAMQAEPAITFTGRRAGDPVKWSADIDRISQLGFRPQFDLKDGITETVAWYQEAVSGEVL